MASGCLLDPQAGHRPARFHVGPNTRAVSVPAVPAPDAAQPTGGAARSSTSTGPDEQQMSATSIAMQFTMATAYPLYTDRGGDGRLHLPGSNLARRTPSSVWSNLSASGRWR
jgi:hypothetical protein